MIKFYKKWTHKGFRIVRPRTFISRLYPPSNLNLVQENVFPQFRPGLTLFFNTDLNRYCLYKEWMDKYVLIGVVDSGKNLGYREPGEWMLHALRKHDIFKAGTIDPGKALKEYERELDKPTEQEVDKDRRLKELADEMRKDWDRVLSGRIGLMMVPIKRPLHPKVKKEKVVFGFRTKNGKIYRRVRKRKCR